MVDNRRSSLAGLPARGACRDRRGSTCGTRGACRTRGSCGAGRQSESLAVALPALDNPLMLAIQDTFKNGFGADYDVQVASADGDPNKQATQVENFTAMKVNKCL